MKNINEQLEALEQALKEWRERYEALVADIKATTENN